MENKGPKKPRRSVLEICELVFKAEKAAEQSDSIYAKSLSEKASDLAREGRLRDAEPFAEVALIEAGFDPDAIGAGHHAEEQEFYQTMESEESFRERVKVAFSYVNQAKLKVSLIGSTPEIEWALLSAANFAEHGDLQNAQEAANRAVRLAKELERELERKNRQNGHTPGDDGGQAL